MLDKKILAENIRRFRKKLNLTQDQLADKLYVSPQAVSAWERQLSEPELESICVLADLFEITIDELLKPSANNKEYMIGIDGGGTKTEFVLFDKSGIIFERCVLSASNPTDLGADECCNIVKCGIDLVMGSKYNVTNIFAGIAGYKSFKDKKDIESFLTRRFSNSRIRLESDMTNVLSCSDYPIGVICGTGSIAFLRNGNDVSYIGGKGYLFDEKGSGYDIARDAVSEVFAQYDGIRSKTPLYNYIQDAIGLPIQNSIDKLYKGGKHYIASLAPAVFAAYEEDEKARKIISSNADRVALLIKTAQKRLNYTGKIVACGGLFKNEIFKNAIQSRINSTLYCPPIGAIYGACVEAMKMADKKANPEFCANFEKSYKEICKYNNKK